MGRRGSKYFRAALAAVVVATFVSGSITLGLQDYALRKWRRRHFVAAHTRPVTEDCNVGFTISHNLY